MLSPELPAEYLYPHPHFYLLNKLKTMGGVGVYMPPNLTGPKVINKQTQIKPLFSIKLKNKEFLKNFMLKFKNE